MPDDPIEIELYTDGACSGNPGPGGWAFILRHLPTGKEREESGGEPRTTKPVKNVELWKQLDELIQKHDVTFTHVRGHSGHEENERCDELAVAAYQKYL